MSLAAGAIGAENKYASKWKGSPHSPATTVAITPVKKSSLQTLPILQLALGATPVTAPMTGEWSSASCGGKGRASAEAFHLDERVRSFAKRGRVSSHSCS